MLCFACNNQTAFSFNISFGDFSCHIFVFVYREFTEYGTYYSDQATQTIDHINNDDDGDDGKKW